MKSIIGAVLIAATTTQASALSCNFGNTGAAWNEATQTSTEFVTVRGKFWLPDAWRTYEEEDYVLPARFEGVILHADGTTERYRTHVQVHGACINGDCGYLSNGQDVLTFIYNTQDAPHTYSMPCSNFPLAPTEQITTDILSCMNDGPCDVETFY